MAGGWAWLRRLALLDAAVIAMAVGIFEAQAHLRTIFLQVEELLAVERSATLPGRFKHKSRHSTAEHVNVMRTRTEAKLQAASSRGHQRASVLEEGFFRARAKNQPPSSFLSQSAHVQPAGELTVG